jgi:inner membrane protein
MNPVTHCLMGWTWANAGPLTRPQRAAVTFASVIPDVDGLGILVDWATASSAHPTSLYAQYHHVVGHNLLGAAVAAVACAAIRGPRRALCAAFGLVSFHLHLLGDLVGSRGPDGSQWEIAYLWPFSSAWQWRVSWQWELNAWPNVAITLALVAATLYLAWRRGFSLVELFSTQADAALVSTLRARFPRSPG